MKEKWYTSIEAIKTATIDVPETIPIKRLANGSLFATSEQLLNCELSEGPHTLFGWLSSQISVVSDNDNALVLSPLIISLIHFIFPQYLPISKHPGPDYSVTQKVSKGQLGWDPR